MAKPCEARGDAIVREGLLRTIVVYGNCQARAVRFAFGSFLEGFGYDVRGVRSWEHLGQPQRLLSPEQLGSCVALFEQIGNERFPQLDSLPAGCAVVRFPSLDTNLLWPFACSNPFDEARLPDFPGGRFAYGDRILLRAIEKGWNADRVVEYYLGRYADYRVDLGRLAKLELARLRGRDASAGVPMADVVEDVVTAPLFWSNNHPRAPLIATLVRRLAEAGSRSAPELAAFSVAGEALERFDGRGESVPIHPGVAAELGLAWYDPQTRYQQVDGSSLTFEEYVRAFVDWSIEQRDRQRDRGTNAKTHDQLGWRPPLEGPTRFAGRVSGTYPDSFAGPLVHFELEALDAVETFTLDLYYPPMHRRAAEVTCEVGPSKAQTMVEPGSSFTLALPAPLARGERARVLLTCSETLNMSERGEGVDDRDLAVLILKMRAE